ncbi:hypothetical protein CASFOL_019668 [Castilleja foliolosa]|uniref:Bidirectional sugar transporter SWEET n=1 Tax=Castilleja foliolosa TaxID=1961234 RepID=A0ABD3CYP7_9LAMI
MFASNSKPETNVEQGSSFMTAVRKSEVHVVSSSNVGDQSGQTDVRKSEVHIVSSSNVGDQSGQTSFLQIAPSPLRDSEGLLVEARNSDTLEIGDNILHFPKQKPSLNGAGYKFNTTRTETILQLNEQFDSYAGDQSKESKFSKEVHVTHENVTSIQLRRLSIPSPPPGIAELVDQWIRRAANPRVERIESQERPTCDLNCKDLCALWRRAFLGPYSRGESGTCVTNFVEKFPRDLHPLTAEGPVVRGPGLTVFFHTTEVMATSLYAIIGSICFFLLFLSPILTFIKIRARKSVGDFDSLPYVVTFTSAGLWLYYGILDHGVAIIIVNAFGVVIEALYITMYMYYATSDIRTLMVKKLAVGVVILLLTIPVTLVTTHSFFRVEIVGWRCTALSVLVAVSPVFDIVRVVKTRDVQYMSFWLSLALALNGAAWNAYGVDEDNYCVIPNGFGCALGVIQILIYVGVRITNFIRFADFIRLISSSMVVST